MGARGRLSPLVDVHVGARIARWLRCMHGTVDALKMFLVHIRAVGADGTL
jgi:hypothetical protein